MDYTFNASQVHFQAALDKARLARKRHDQAIREREQGFVGGGTEPRARETDATIAAVMLTQAAAESYGSWVHVQASTHPGFLKWQDAWKRFPQAAAKLGRPADFVLDSDRRATLSYLGAWRNYLMHTDPQARENLHKVLVDQGKIPPGAEESTIVALLNADLAEWAVTEFEKLFRWAQDRTGIPAPFTQGAWLGEGFYQR
ncbi:hypothetical protein PS9374_04460 [Planomonospora sphaerica]|uniref:Uncharacterized protein n=1 Tax=Planomonospora sphaerica TaxID=161355 RepID=A0A161LMX3_9ACTN|nr:hypothetical protein [Planomonospora sphaerica]GAT68795.1 hypothetical protein PS9374_04460 [Planomonospora sphaerica]